jgi:hypothetical protein
MTECISNGRTFWRATDDSEAERKPRIKCATIAEASFFNEREHFGIGWTVNEIVGERRLKENVVRIISWAVEFDELEKPEQARRIRQSSLRPSLVVESARGYQAYWDAINGTTENYNLICKSVAKKLGADQAGISIVRTMRAPFFWHWKDTRNPFAVRVVSFNDSKYTESDMLEVFEVKKPEPIIYERKRVSYSGLTKSDKLDQIGAFEGLRRLSGTSYVNHQNYVFVSTGPNRSNILINGKATSCFISNDKVFASEASPTILQWLQYREYGHTKDQAWEIIFKLFPEVFGENKNG